MRDTNARRLLVTLLGTIALVQVMAGSASADTMPPPTFCAEGASPGPAQPACVAGEPGCLASTPWPKFHGDRRNTAQSPQLGPNAATLKWVYSGFDKILGSPGIGLNGDIYIALGWKVCAIDPNTHEAKWCKQMHADVSQSSAGVDKEGIIYIGDRANILTAINPVDGSTVWELIKNREGDVRSSVNFGPDGTIYFAYTGQAGKFGVMTAVDRDNGTIKWWCSVNDVIYSAPAFSPDGRQIYIASRKGYLYAFNPQGGIIWTQRVGKNISFSSPAVAADGTIYIGADTGLNAVDSNGNSKWTFPTFGTAQDSSPAIATNGTIYIGSVKASTETFYAVKQDGSPKWQFGPVPGGSSETSYQAIGADGIVYVGFGSMVRAFKPDGTLLWQYQLGGSIPSSPAIGGNALPGGHGEGVLYIGSRDKNLYAFATQRSGGAGGPTNEAPVANAGPGHTVQAGQPVTLDGSQSFDPDHGPQALTYTWDFGDNTAVRTNAPAQVSHTYATPGQYTASLTVSDGSLPDTSTTVVTVLGAGSFSDSFTRPDASTPGNGWVEAAGDLGIIANQLRNGAVNGFHIGVRPTLFSNNQQAEADFASMNNNASTRLGLVLRYQGPNNYYVLDRRTGGTTALRISKFVDGDETVLKSLPVPIAAVNTFFHLKASASGQTLTLTLNGTTSISVDDPTYTAGTPGIFIHTKLSSPPQHKVDNFSATAF